MAQLATQNIYVGQEVTLNYTDTDSIDMDAVDFRVDYWAPSNLTDTPTGTVSDTEITTVASSAVVEVKVLINILSEPTIKGNEWRFQIIDNTSGVGWTPMSVDVKYKGTQI